MLSLRPSCLYIAACEMNGPTMVRLLVLLQEKLEAPGGRHGKKCGAGCCKAAGGGLSGCTTIKAFTV